MKGIGRNLKKTDSARSEYFFTSTSNIASGIFPVCYGNYCDVPGLLTYNYRAWAILAWSSWSICKSLDV